jgi:hypothetical protein
MASKRLELTPTVIKDALKLALKGSDGIDDFCDRLQPYLVLRVRGHVASWLVKTRVRTLKIGDAMPPATAVRIPSLRKRGSAVGNEFLGLRGAREKAKQEWAKLGNAVDIPEEKPCWTWSQLIEEYRKHIAGMREDASGRPIYPSAETQSDVRQIFGRKEVAQQANLLLSNLNEDWFEDVQKELHEANNYDAYRKFRAYGSAALNWAATYRRKESGLTGRKWWLLAERRRRTEDEVTQKVERDRTRARRKEEFKASTSACCSRSTKDSAPRVPVTNASHPGCAGAFGGTASPDTAAARAPGSPARTSNSRIRAASLAGAWPSGNPK